MSLTFVEKGVSLCKSIFTVGTLEYASVYVSQFCDLHLLQKHKLCISSMTEGCVTLHMSVTELTERSTNVKFH